MVYSSSRFRWQPQTVPHSKFLSQVFQVGFWCSKKQIYSTHRVDWDGNLKMKWPQPPNGNGNRLQLRLSVPILVTRQNFFWQKIYHFKEALTLYKKTIYIKKELTQYNPIDPLYFLYSSLTLDRTIWEAGFLHLKTRISMKQTILGI